MQPGSAILQSVLSGESKQETMTGSNFSPLHFFHTVANTPVCSSVEKYYFFTLLQTGWGLLVTKWKSNKISLRKDAVITSAIHEKLIKLNPKTIFLLLILPLSQKYCTVSRKLKNDQL